MSKKEGLMDFSKAGSAKMSKKEGLMDISKAEERQNV